ncbi:MAG: sigma-54 dependent transcriptional regulator [Clostridia bacterium]|nr:sigma-54 dependent transcriptional regulator [Clostridia bacterium]
MIKPAIWILDDEQGICTSLYFALKDRYSVRTFVDSQAVLENLERESCDLILIDLKLGEENGIEVMKKIKAMDPELVVIMMTAYASIATSVDAMKAGAYTYLTKPLDLSELDVVLTQALEIRKLNKRVSILSDELVSLRHYDKIIGESDAMKEVYSLIDQLKDVDANVLITGESGTGKELVAKAIHTEGKRKDNRFVVVNCAAIPENLLEIEFFGNRKGAFTGATADRKGKFEIADGGTIFLDEIGDMPLNLQGKLLRVLQDKEFTPIGASEPRRVDVRVLAATNRDLEHLIAEKAFRADLYYRLNVMSISLPPLRERREDIPLLCDSFIKQYSFEMRKGIKGCTKEAERLISSYDFPGNVRQLSNILEFATIVCKNEYVDVIDLPKEIRSGADTMPADMESSLDEYLAGNTLRTIEKRAIELALKKHGGHREKTAAALGISRRGLQNKIIEYGIKGE